MKFKSLSTNLVRISVVPQQLPAALAAVLVVEHLHHLGAISGGAEGERSDASPIVTLLLLLMLILILMRLLILLILMLLLLRGRSVPTPQGHARAPPRDHHTCRLPDAAHTRPPPTPTRLPHTPYRSPESMTRATPIIVLLFSLMMPRLPEISAGAKVSRSLSGSRMTIT